MRRLLVAWLLVVSLLGGCADMAMPTMTVEIAFGDNWNEASPTWVDVTSAVRHDPGITVNRSISRVSRTRPGSLTLALDNRDRDYDPDYASSPYTGDLVPMVPIRVRAVHNGTTHDVFRGHVVRWEVVTDDYEDSYTVVTATDGLSVLELLDVQSVWESEVLSHSPRAWWRLGEATGTTAVDASGNDYHGTYDGPTLSSVATPIALSSLSHPTFDGSDDRVAFEDSAAWSGDLGALSVAGWFKVPSSGSAYIYFQSSPANQAQDALALYVSGSSQKLIGYTNDGTEGSGNADLISAATYDDDAWHFGVMTHDGTTGYALYVDGSSVDTFTDGGSVTLGDGQDPYSGYLNFQYSNGTVGEVILFDKELSAAEVLALYSAGNAPWGSELTSARITNILDTIGWPTALRDLDTGQSTMNQLSAAGSALALAFQAEETENGVLYVARDGDITFDNRLARAVTTYAATFSNDGSDTPYHGLRFFRDDTVFRTAATVTDKDGNTTTAEGTNAQYPGRTISRTTYTESATEPTDYANWLATEFGTPLTDAELELRAGTATGNTEWAEILTRELTDLVNLEATPVGGGTANDWDMFIEGIRHRITVGYWQTTLELSNAQYQRFFTLDDAILGELDGIGRLGW